MFDRTNLLFCLTVIFFINCNDTESNVEDVIPEESDSLWTLIWNEDFNEPTLDNNKWNVLQWRPGWVNNENQAYTDRDTNLYFENGNLVIRALVEPGYYDQDYQGNSYNSDYTSGRINTAGKFSTTYGRFDIRAKLPKGRGSWPARVPCAPCRAAGDRSRAQPHARRASRRCRTSTCRAPPSPKPSSACIRRRGACRRRGTRRASSLSAT